MIKVRFLSVVIVLIGVSAEVVSAQSKKVIIDTDPAMGYFLKDVDDGLTVLMALNSPELEIPGITTTYGNVKQQRAYAKAAEILEQVGRGNIPLHPGARGPEDLGRATPASRFIVDTIRSYPGEVTILVLGSLTDAPTASHGEPRLIALTREVVSIGGNITALGEHTRQSTADLNYGDDPRSAQMVGASGIPFTMINIKLCEPIKIRRERSQDTSAGRPFLGVVFPTNLRAKKTGERPSAKGGLCSYGRGIPLLSCIAGVAGCRYFSSSSSAKSPGSRSVAV